MKISYLFIIGLACSFTGCQKSTVTPVQLQGTYKGSLKSIANGNTAQLLSSSVAVTISGNLYQSTLQGPASSKGSFRISNNELIFTDSLAHTANFNWNELLNGTYTQGTIADSLVWTKTLGTFKYVYTLKKQ